MLLLLLGLTDKGNWICNLFFDLFAFRLRCGKIIWYSHFLTFEKADIISKCHHGFPPKWHLRNNQRNSILIRCCHPGLGSALDWLKVCFNQSEVLPRYGRWYIISMEFFLLLLGRHFAEKPIVGLQNVTFFLRQQLIQNPVSNVKTT